MTGERFRTKHVCALIKDLNWFRLTLALTPHVSSYDCNCIGTIRMATASSYKDPSSADETGAKAPEDGWCVMPDPSIAQIRQSFTEYVVFDMCCC